MTYQEEGQARLRRLRTKQAITLAMQGQWREAIAINKDIVEDFPTDIKAYNRLGRAYMELGEHSLAREAYSRALKLDHYNTIAKKNLRRLSLLGERPISSAGDSDTAKPQHFIEETGKAGVVNLYRLAPEEILAAMVAGDKVNLRISNSGLIVENNSGQYLGEVEPSHGLRLIRLMKGGHEYSTAIVSATEDKVTVIVREIYQHPSQDGQVSFPVRNVGGLQPYVSDRMVRRDFRDGEELVAGTGYTIIGGEEGTELLLEETIEDEQDKPEEENDE
ncbi:hypothetical protein ES703_72436 [subsurface metagenome]